MENWAKTLLSIYRYLDRVVGAIDKIVMTRAVNSFFTSGSNLSFNSIENVSKDILNLTERKVTLINLKVILEETLKQTKPELARFLVANLVEGKTCFECAEIFAVSLRTYFRKQNLAVDSFVNALGRSGYNCDFFEDMLKNETWILAEREKFQTNSNHITDNALEGVAKISHKKKKFGNVNLQTRNNLHF